MSDIEVIKSRLDIVEVISKYVELKPSGSNYKGLSPFKTEKTPSFMVSPQLQIFKDFSSGIGGDAIKFLMEFEKLSFREALEKAAEMAGVELTNNYNSKDTEKEKLKKRIIEANALTTQFYQYILKQHKSGKPGRDYASERNIGSSEIEKFLFGYAPSSYYNLKTFLKKKGYEEKELIEFGLLVERNNDVIDKFRNRLMQPIRDLNGHILGFSGRYIGDYENAPKYLNSPATEVYDKKSILYGMYEGSSAIRKSDFAIIVEGNIDPVSSHRVGIENIVAPFGTSFTPGQAKLLKRFTDMVYFSFDTDEAGVNGLIRAIKIAEDFEFKHKVLDLGKYKDADDLINSEPELWEKTISNAINSVEYLVKLFSEKEDLGSIDGKRQLQSRILPVLKLIKKRLDIKHYIKQVALLLELSTDDVEKLISNEKTYIPRPKELHDDEIIKKEKEEFMLYKHFLALIVQSENVDTTQFNPDIFQDETQKELFEIIQQTDNKITNEILGSLSDEVIKLYSDVSLIDTSTNADANTIENLYKRLYKEYLNKKLLKLRIELSVSSDESLLEKITEITNELKKI
ncbi:MAG: DNA primase [Candidatus Dojkabacteria bacterium]|nr:DNA primase [Candidatus Dojkabacteria bacterium]